MWWITWLSLKFCVYFCCLYHRPQETVSLPPPSRSCFLTHTLVPSERSDFMLTYQWAWKRPSDCPRVWESSLVSGHWKVVQVSVGHCQPLGGRGRTCVKCVFMGEQNSKHRKPRSGKQCEFSVHHFSPWQHPTSHTDTLFWALHSKVGIVSGSAFLIVWI